MRLIMKKIVKTDIIDEIDIKSSFKIAPNKTVLAYEMFRDGKAISEITRVLELDESQLSEIRDDASNSQTLKLYKDVENALVKKSVGGKRTEIIRKYRPKTDEDGETEIDDRGEPKLILVEVIEKEYEVEPDSTSIKTFLVANGINYNPDKKNQDLVDNKETAFDGFNVMYEETVDELDENMSAESLDDENKKNSI
jgi:hypothetical protein